MTLQTSGAISLSQVNVELKLSATATISLNDAAVRKLLGKASGTISMSDAYGKSSEIRFVNTAARTSVSIFTLMGSPTAAGNYVFENKAEINASTDSYALRTGTFPTGSTLTIINNSYIYGLGGVGSSDVTIAGGAGGTAIYLDMPCSIDNTNGYILAGGGGGGSVYRAAGPSAIQTMIAGGGGGAGLSVGAAGVNFHNITAAPSYTTTNIAPKQGTATAGGAGGTVKWNVSDNSFSDSAYGGAGGTNGAEGSVGTTVGTGTSTSAKHVQTIGVAGAAGRAVSTNGKSLTQIAGFTSTRVKGAIG